MDAFLEDLDKENYAIAYFPAKRYGEISNALSESYNNMIMPYRSLPIYELIESLRRNVMLKMEQKKLASAAWHTVLCPKAENKLRDSLNSGRDFRVIRSTDRLFEVIAGDDTVMVDLDQRVCSCKL